MQQMGNLQTNVAATPEEMYRTSSCAARQDDRSVDRRQRWSMWETKEGRETVLCNMEVETEVSVRSERLVEEGTRHKSEYCANLVRVPVDKKKELRYFLEQVQEL